MDLNHLTDDERLIAERAVLMARAVNKKRGQNGSVENAQLPS